jgi:hypothetical protein
MQVFLVVCEVEDRVTHKLSRPMPGYFSATLNAMHCMRALSTAGVELQIVKGGAPPKSID